jgi:hypothetical protein
MKNLLWFALVIPFSLLLSQFSKTGSQQEKWEYLFNGKDLSGWETYLGPRFDSLGHRLKEPPIGVHSDPDHVFGVAEENGIGVIRISGQNFGSLYTNREFENYHLQLMFKWGSTNWPPKKGKKKDSGLLYHSVGENGVDAGAWMRSQEFQIEEGNCGDYWGVAGGIEDIPAIKKSDSEYIYRPGAPMYHFSEANHTGRYCIKRSDAEKATGQWNTLDLFCHGDTSVHMVNGVVMMVLYHSSQLENGKELPLTKGKIQIQSEGAEVFYKEIRIAPLPAIPAYLTK